MTISGNSDEWAFQITVSVIVSLVFIANAIWIFLDAMQRGKNPWIAIILLALLGWPLSNVWWLWLRPPIQVDQ